MELVSSSARALEACGKRTKRYSSQQRGIFSAEFEFIGRQQTERRSIEVIVYFQVQIVLFTLFCDCVLLSIESRQSWNGFRCFHLPSPFAAGGGETLTTANTIHKKSLSVCVDGFVLFFLSCEKVDPLARRAPVPFGASSE